MRAPDILRQRRAQVLAGVAALVLVVGAVALTRGGTDDRVSLEGTTTTAEDATTTTRATTSTTAPTTTTAVTTTTVPSTTTTSAPVVVTTAPPATVAPPPPPSSGGTLDLLAVVAFAKAHRPDTPMPYMHSGAPCEVGSERIQDAGDDADGDLASAELVRDCEGIFRLFTGTDDPVNPTYWVEVDATAGGCGGVDLVAVTWPTASSTMGAVVRITGCSSGSWTAVDTTADPAFPGLLLDFRGSTFGDPAGFQWRAGMLGSAADTVIDRAPSAGFAAFQR